MTSNLPDPLVSSADAAAYLGVSKDALQGWVKAGKVTPTIITPGGMARWDLADLVDQLRPGRGAGPAAGE